MKSLIGTLTGQPLTQGGFLHAEAARGLELRLLLGVAGGHLFEVLRALLRVLLGHRLTRDFRPRGGGGLRLVLLLFSHRLVVLVALPVRPCGRCRGRWAAVLRLLLLGEVLPLARHHLVEVHLVPVELRAVHADELGLAADRDAAGAAHPGAVDHDRVQAGVGRDLVRLGDLAGELHHDRRADHDRAADLRAALDDPLELVGDEALLAVGAVVGGDPDLAAREPSSAPRRSAGSSSARRGSRSRGCPRPSSPWRSGGSARCRCRRRRRPRRRRTSRCASACRAGRRRAGSSAPSRAARA